MTVDGMPHSIDSLTTDRIPSPHPIFDNDKEQSARQTYASTNRLISLRPWNLPP